MLSVPSTQWISVNTMSCKRLPCWTLGWPASSSQSSQRLFCRWALGGGGDAGHTWWHRYAEDNLLHITTIEPSVVDVGKSFLLNLPQIFTRCQLSIPSATTKEITNRVKQEEAWDWWHEVLVSGDMVWETLLVLSARTFVCTKPSSVYLTETWDMNRLNSCPFRRMRNILSL